MPTFIKSHTYHIVLSGANAHSLNVAIASWTKRNTDAIIQHMKILQYADIDMEAHIFYSDYPPEVKKGKYK